MSEPRMSVVLVTDRYETIRAVVQRFARQTIAGAIELVLVAPRGEGLVPDPADVAPLLSHRLVEVDDVMPLWIARAAGVRATTGPVVTVGETHALPAPTWGERVLEAMDAGRAVVVPGFTNANPDSATSWSNLMADYGRWSRARPSGGDGGAPSYNTSFTRPVIDALEDHLDELWAPGFDAPGAIHAAGYGIWHESRAVLHHINVSKRGAWPQERYEHGRLQAARRAAHWSLARRALYIAASPLIVPVTLRRVLPGFRAARAVEDMPRLTGACLVAGSVFKTVGEVFGFAFGAGTTHARRVDEMEIHKLRYTRRGVAGLSPDA